MGFGHECWTLSSSGPLLDINECLNYPRRLCAHNCENTKGSYRCSCTTGFRLSHDERSCEGRSRPSPNIIFLNCLGKKTSACVWTDINECEANPCKQECINTYGSYSCYCQPGYKKNEKNESLCDGNAGTPALITDAKALGLCRCWPCPTHHTSCQISTSVPCRPTIACAPTTAPTPTVASSAPARPRATLYPTTDKRARVCLGALAWEKDFKCEKRSPSTNCLPPPRRYRRVQRQDPRLRRWQELLQHPGRVPLPFLQMSSQLQGNRSGVRHAWDKLLLWLGVTMCGFSPGAFTQNPKKCMWGEPGTLYWL